MMKNTYYESGCKTCYHRARKACDPHDIECSFCITIGEGNINYWNKELTSQLIAQHKT